MSSIHDRWDDDDITLVEDAPHGTVYEIDGEPSQFTSLLDAQSAIRAFGPDWAHVYIEIYPDRTLRDEDGQIVGRVIPPKEA